MTDKSPDTRRSEPVHAAASLFAEELRRLRVEAGNPPFRQMARDAHYAASTLAEALNGRRLPSESVVRAFALACGADPGYWVGRLAQAAAAGEDRSPDVESETAASDVSAAGEASEDESAGNDGPELGRFNGPTRHRILHAAFLVVGLGVGLSCGLALADSRAKPGTSNASSLVPSAGIVTSIPTAAPHAAVGDGADPGAAGCKKDFRLVDKSAVMNGSKQIGALELLYSRHCGAGWARLYLYPGEPVMLGYVQVRASDGRESSIAYPLIKQVDDYTNVVVPPSGGCLGATAVVDEVGRTPMTASIVCQATQ